MTCSFCGRRVGATTGRRVIIGLDGVGICSDCVRLAARALGPGTDRVGDDDWSRTVRGPAPPATLF